jgi:hypothetical protein
VSKRHSEEYEAAIIRDQINTNGGFGCWEWTGITNPKGYGTCKFQHRSTYAHRAIYIITRGEIPKGMFICHDCDNPRCCRPDHLFLGTAAQNNADMRIKGRSARGERNGCAKLTEGDVVKIRSDARSAEIIASEFGVSSSLISMIRTRKLWIHI